MEQRDIETRAQRDIERGDYGLARERLTSFLNSVGYDDAILMRLGALSFEMHDLFQAGRFWLLSSMSGPDVDRAVAEFLRRCGGNPHQAASQLPNRMRLKSLEQYPLQARVRLTNLGMEKVVLSQKAVRRSGAPMGFRGKLIVVGLIMLLIFCAASAIVGTGIILSWIWKLLLG